MCLGSGSRSGWSVRRQWRATSPEGWRRCCSRLAQWVERWRGGSEGHWGSEGRLCHRSEWRAVLQRRRGRVIVTAALIAKGVVCGGRPLMVRSLPTLPRAALRPCCARRGVATPWRLIHGRAEGEEMRRRRIDRFSTPRYVGGTLAAHRLSMRLRRQARRVTLTTASATANLEQQTRARARPTGAGANDGTGAIGTPGTCVAVAVKSSSGSGEGKRAGRYCNQPQHPYRRHGCGEAYCRRGGWWRVRRPAIGDMRRMRRSRQQWRRR